jgi:hypothetical protein
MPEGINNISIDSLATKVHCPVQIIKIRSTAPNSEKKPLSNIEKQPSKGFFSKLFS